MKKNLTYCAKITKVIKSGIGRLRREIININQQMRPLGEIAFKQAAYSASLPLLACSIGYSGSSALASPLPPSQMRLAQNIERAERVQSWKENRDIRIRRRKWNDLTPEQKKAYLLRRKKRFQIAKKKELEKIRELLSNPWPMPSITIESPSGFGADFGLFYIGTVYAHTTRSTHGSTNKHDGSGVIGTGIGNAEKYFGVDLALSINSVFADSDQTNIAFDEGGLDIKIHHRFPGNFSIAAGKDLALYWGKNSKTIHKSQYLNFSKIFYLTRYSDDWFSSLSLTAGVGNQRFLPQNAVRLVKKDGYRGFGALALRIQEPVSIIVDWGGFNLNAGLSITPFRKHAFFLNPAIVDIVGTNLPGARFVFSMSYGLRI